MPITKNNIRIIINNAKEIYTASRIATTLISQGSKEEEVEKAIISVIKKSVENLNKIVNTVKEQE